MPVGNLFEELKRRKVVRVAGVYAVVAWLLIQVSNTVLPTFGAPTWVNQTLIFLFIIGFPVAVILAWAYEVTPEGIRADNQVQASPGLQATSVQPINYIILGIVLLVAGFQIADRFLGANQSVPASVSNAVITASSDSTLSRRTSINIGNTAPLPGPLTNALIALSADGSKLVYSVLRPELGAQYLYLRHLDQLQERELFAGVAYTPFFSPDGEWVGFSQGGQIAASLHKVSISGGAPQLLTEGYRIGSGGFWSVDGTVFHTLGSDGQLGRISESGGALSPLGIDEANAGSVQSWPYLLPGDDALLYTVALPDRVADGRIDLWVQSTGEVRTIIQNGYNARYVPTGHIVFVRAAALWAVPFDAERLQTTGPERPVIQGIQTNTGGGSTPYAFSEDGLLVYLPGGDTRALAQETTLVWVDRDGNEETLPQARNFLRWSVSPEGRQLAVSIRNSGADEDIWVYDLTRQTLSRLTFDNADDRFPVWTPDGERIVFYSARDGGSLWWQAANGTGTAERLLVDDSEPTPYAFTLDGAQLLYNAGGNIYTLTPGAEVPSQALIQSEFTTQRPDLSPDRRWLAYESNETGRLEIYVRPFPNIEDGKWQISSAGGRSPKWSPDGLELFFGRPVESGDNGVWVAQRDSADAMRFSAPVRAFTGSDAVVSADSTFDISADGSRILLRKQPDGEVRETEVTSLVAVENWFAELKRLAPPDSR